MMITENLKNIEERIQEACRRAGRERSSVRLVAVSKTKPVEDIEEAMRSGIRDFGENKPQELKEKHDCLPSDIRWHQIGHLQRNKVKYVIDRACLIHSVDSLRLAQMIDEEARKHQLVMPVLIEVNVAGEETKFGVSPAEAEPLIREISKLENVRIRGLMTIAPYTENADENRVYFRALRNLSIDIAGKNIDNVSMCELSMGMTCDFEAAIEEGATIIRVGSAIFGERNYNI